MPKNLLIQALADALTRLRENDLLSFDQIPEILVQRPSDAAFGDYSTNVAMLLAREAKMPPRKIAELVVAELHVPKEILAGAEIAGAGFINFRLTPAALQQVVCDIECQGEHYGRSNRGAGTKIQIEFVSANPTGPLHVGHGRAAALGDTLAHLLSWVGYDVTREFYVNDAANSSQIRKFGESLEARYLQVLGQDASVPEDGYHGEYVMDIAKEILAREGDKLLAMSPEDRHTRFAHLAKELIIEGQKRDLARFNVHHDVWFYESSLFETGAIYAALEQLKEGGHTYEAEGALWLRSTDFGDEKDRVLVRSTSVPTYLASDAAYHHNKYQRGFDTVIDIWGPDHHGYVARTKGVIQAMGYARDRLEIIIHQIVRLFSGGEMVRMSKRAGDIILLSEVLDEVGSDAARYFFLMRSADSHLDFDLELAKKESSDNPVYYVQYAHARICSIFRQAEESGIALPESGEADLSLLTQPKEFDLLRKLADFPVEVETAAVQYEPHRMTRYAQELANALHLFYTECRVLTDDAPLTAARLTLLRATQTVLRNALGILGISAPERM